MSTHVVTAIEVAGRDRRARRLLFDYESEPRITSAAAVRSLGIDVGSEVDPDVLVAAEIQLARDRAIQYLGYRDRTLHEMMARLTEDGYPREIAQRICDRFVELDLVNDQRIATTWAAHRAAAGYGPQRIVRELDRKGIPREMAAAAVESLEGDPLQRARELVAGRPCETPKERDRLLRRLVSRGYDLSTALSAVKQVTGSHEDT